MQDAPEIISNKVTQICQQAIDSFSNSLQNPRQIISYIDCNTLDTNYLNNNIRDAPLFLKMFDELTKNDPPFVYWFEILHGPDSQTIHQRISKYKETSVRGVPALRKLKEYNSRILYVGKSTVGFWGRLITHLGYLSGKGTTQGLQLDHWTKDLCLELQLNILRFPPAMADYLSIVEYALAKELQPIIGKHRR